MSFECVGCVHDIPTFNTLKTTHIEWEHVCVECFGRLFRKVRLSIDTPVIITEESDCCICGDETFISFRIFLCRNHINFIEEDLPKDCCGNCECEIINIEHNECENCGWEIK